MTSLGSQLIELGALRRCQSHSDIVSLATENIMGSLVAENTIRRSYLDAGWPDDGGTGAPEAAQG